MHSSHRWFTYLPNRSLCGIGNDFSSLECAFFFFFFVIKNRISDTFDHCQRIDSRICCWHSTTVAHPLPVLWRHFRWDITGLCFDCCKKLEIVVSGGAVILTSMCRVQLMGYFCGMWVFSYFSLARFSYLNVTLIFIIFYVKLQPASACCR